MNGSTMLGTGEAPGGNPEPQSLNNDWNGVAVAGTHHTAEPAVETIAHLDFAHEQPCLRGGCEAGHPPARWIIRTPQLCSCIDFWCESCRTLFAKMCAENVGRWATLFCTQCDTTKRLPVVDISRVVIIRPIS